MSPPAENVTDIRSLEQFRALVSSSPFVAIQAHAEWCGPCKAISPIYNKHALSNADKAQLAFARFDTDDVPDLAQELGIRSIPSFFFFVNGQKANSLTGANPAALEKGIKELAVQAGNLSTNEDF